MTPRWTARAIADLAAIHAHIAADNPSAADALRDRVLHHVEQTLAAHPLIGRPGRVAGTRESVVHPSYVLVYRVRGDRIDLLTLRHAARRWPGHLP